MSYLVCVYPKKGKFNPNIHQFVLEGDFGPPEGVEVYEQTAAFFEHTHYNVQPLEPIIELLKNNGKTIKDKEWMSDY